MQKVLFLTESYPDFLRSATILCTKRLIECMAMQSDFEVHCLCTQQSGDFLEESVKNVHVHRVRKTPWKLFYDYLNNQPELQNFILKIQKVLTIPFFPCRDLFMLQRYKRKAISLYLKHHYDIVIAEHHGYNTLMTGCYLKEKFPLVKYYPVLWDPILGQTKPTFLPDRYIDNHILKCENRVNKAADMVFSIQAAKRIYEKINDTARNKRIYYDIPSVLPPEQEKPTKYLSLIKKGYINVTFSGLLGIPSRDPSYIINILNQTSLAERINILFFSKGLSKKDQQKLSDSFKGSIVFHEYIPLGELHTIYRHSDFLLNISHINANMTPSKIFEYMSYGKPIISTYFTNGDAAKKYLDIYPESIVINQQESEEENINKMEKFLVSNHPIVEFKIVQELFSLNTPEKFVEILRELK